jgi:predicted nucleic acid-binding protein
LRYLVDTSALTRILRRQASPAWDNLERRGLLAICEPALTETLLIAKTKDYVPELREHRISLGPEHAL